MYPVVPRARFVADLHAGSVVGTFIVSPSDVAIPQLSEFLKTTDLDLFIDLRESSADEVVALLNAGALAVVVSELVDGVPLERQILRVESPSDASKALSDGCGVFLMQPSRETIAEISTMASKLAEMRKSELPFVFCEDLEVLPSQVSSVVELSLVTKVLAARLHTDRTDGLFTTVVTNRAQQVLGVCYSSLDSLKEAMDTRTGVYQSRTRGLWRKGASSGATQKLLRISLDCDSDALQFVVDQHAPGFCHNNTTSCFGELGGLTKLCETVESRLKSAPAGSYTHRLATEKGLLEAKIREEADELIEAQTADEVAWEAADLLYFVSVKLAKHGLSIADVETNLDRKSRKITRRPGNAKPAYVQKPAESNPAAASEEKSNTVDIKAPIHMKVLDAKSHDLKRALERPAQSSNAFELARPIVEDIRKRGDVALLEYTAKFERAHLKSPVLSAPFPEELMSLPPNLKEAIDLACANVGKFHSAQFTEPLTVETSPGVWCSRFARPIQKVGLYVPGGSAILPSTAIMLGVPAQVAGCSHIAIATPPRQDGSPSPEVVYVAHKIGASQIVLAGGAQAVAALAYGTDAVPKVDKILGPGNQFVTAAKMIVSTDVGASVSIDMPAGPSEVLVVADRKANKSFVVSDLLSQAEHGPDSQVVLVAIDFSEQDLEQLQAELDRQANLLPRVDVVRKSIAHSTIIKVHSREEALEISNKYAPEHLILQVEEASKLLPLVDNAGSVFVGAWSPESCGDYTSGTNHTLPTYGYARQYSGVNTGSYLKHITAQELTEEGIRNIGPATIDLARCEGLDAHAEAVVIRMATLK